MNIENTLLKLKIYGLFKVLLSIPSEIYRHLWRVTIHGSYSQHGEDLVIDNLLGHKRTGTYVDVGAYDPVNINNTYRFYKRGWTGINIEPNPEKFATLATKRPRDINLNVGVNNIMGLGTMYQFVPDSITTFSPKEAESYIKGGLPLVGKMKVRMLSLKTILKKNHKFGKIDLLSIDTQGYELNVLQSNDWKMFKPRVICIETFKSLDIPTEDKGKINRYLLSKGYRFHSEIGLNSIYFQ